jgi:hypothetical protein
VFPSTFNGKAPTPAPLYRGLGTVAVECVDDGVLDETRSRVLERGAQGLRRAIMLGSLANVWPRRY